MVREAEPKDAETYAKWLLVSATINLLDRKVYDYPLAVHLVVERSGEPTLMNSAHPVMVMEALAPRPEITPLQEGRSLIELFERVKQIARDAGMKEVMFGCKDERVGKYAEGRGFERLSFPVFRIKL